MSRPAEEQELKEIQTEIDKFYLRIQNARSMRLDDEFTAGEYLSYGGEIMKNIATRYIAASPIGKKQIIGSIFPEKLIFSENKLRTT